MVALAVPWWSLEVVCGADERVLLTGFTATITGSLVFLPEQNRVTAQQGLLG